MKSSNLVFVLLCLVVAGLSGCGKKDDPESTATTATTVSKSLPLSPSKETLIACSEAGGAVEAQIACVSEKGTPIITKLADATILHLASGDLRFDEVHSDSDSQMEVEYAGYLPMVNAHVLHIAKYEDGSTLLIDHSTGEQHPVGPAFFKVSENGEYLLESRCDYESDICSWSLGKYAGEQVWSCNLPHLELDASWVEPERIELRRGRAFTERGEDAVASDRDYFVALKEGQWQSDLSCLSEEEEDHFESR